MRSGNFVSWRMAIACSVLSWTGLGMAILAEEGPTPGRLSRGPYLQSLTPDSVILVWRTEGPIEPEVRYRVTGRTSWETGADSVGVRRTREDAPSEPDPLHSAPPGTFQYEVALSGLRPKTTYAYEIFDRGQPLTHGEGFRFTTPPTPGEGAIRLWVLGDSGTGQEEQRAVFATLLQDLASGGKVDGILHVGDMAYSDGTDAEFQRNFFEVYASLLRDTVIWPTLGNHEGHTAQGDVGVGPYFDAFVLPTRGEAGGIPSGKEAYYSFDLGPIHAVCLNSHDTDRSPDGEMARWLKEDLEKTSSPWLLAFWHHPPYTKATHDSDREIQLIEMRTHLMPILESFGVDLVLAGHSHAYERSMLIDAAYGTPTRAEGVILDDGDGHPSGDGPYRKSPGRLPHRGTVVAVVGNGGANLGQRGTLPLMRSSAAEYGSLFLEVDESRLVGVMIDRFGVERDRFAIVKDRMIVPTRVQDPFHLDGPAIEVVEGGHPGELLVSIRPRPAAADARVFVTVDGKVPDDTSPLYQGRFSVTQKTTVRAISIWKDGARRSPVVTVEVEPLPAGFLRRSVAASEDDAEETRAGAMQIWSSDLDLGGNPAKKKAVGIRFRDLALPPGALLREAKIQFQANSPRTIPTRLEIRGELVPDALPFSGNPKDLTSRTRTETRVEWIVPPWTERLARGTQQMTPDLTPILAEILENPGWRSGGAIVFFFEGTGDRSAESADGDWGGAPTLHLQYSTQ